MKINIFEYAAKHKLKYQYKGTLTTEDLYDLSITDLDKLFKTVNAENKQAQEESLLATKTTKNTELEVKIAIIKHIFAEKMAAKDRAAKAAANKAQKQKIMDIMAKRNDQAMEQASDADLQAMLDELDNTSVETTEVSTDLEV